GFPGRSRGQRCAGTFHGSCSTQGVIPASKRGLLWLRAKQDVLPCARLFDDQMASRQEVEKPLDFLDDPTVRAVCAICRKPVRDGERVVSISRNLEQIEPDGAAHNVLDSVLLASLCESCGFKYSEKRIRVIFE